MSALGQPGRKQAKLLVVNGGPVWSGAGGSPSEEAQARLVAVMASVGFEAEAEPLGEGGFPLSVVLSSAAAPRKPPPAFVVLATAAGLGFGPPCHPPAAAGAGASAVARGTRGPACLVEASGLVRRFLGPEAFLCVWDPAATEDALFRQAVFGDGKERANMLTFDHRSVEAALRMVAAEQTGGGRLECPFCGMRGLTEDELWRHVPLHHVYAANPPHAETLRCPVCRQRGGEDPFPVHLRNQHGPCGRGEVQAEYSTGLFAIVVCRRLSDGKFLMVQEFANSGFWLPGGQLDSRESLRAAVVRETEEEAGMRIELKGVLELIR